MDKMWLLLVIVVLSCIKVNVASNGQCGKAICPSNSECALNEKCRCLYSYGLFGNACQRGKEVYEMRNLVLNKTYNKNFDNHSSNEYLKEAMLIESAILNQLDVRAKLTSLKFVRVSSIAKRDNMVVVSGSLVLADSNTNTTTVQMKLNGLISDGYLVNIYATNKTVSIHEPCGVHKCPSMSVCINMNRGAVCKCNSGWRMVKGECFIGPRIFKITGLKLNTSMETYKKGYAEMTDEVFVQKVEALESIFMSKLKPKHSSYAQVQVTKIDPQLNVVVNIFSLSVSSLNNSVVMEDLAQIKMNNGFDSLNMNSNTKFTVGVTDVCELKTYKCTPNSDCIILKDRVYYRCDCVSGYKTVDNKCVKDDDDNDELVIVLPIVIVLIVACMILMIWWGRTSKNADLNFGKKQMTDGRNNDGFHQSN